MSRRLPPSITAEKLPEWLPPGWIVESKVLSTGREVRSYKNLLTGRKFANKDDVLHNDAMERDRRHKLEGANRRLMMQLAGVEVAGSKWPQPACGLAQMCSENDGMEIIEYSGPSTGLETPSELLLRQYPGSQMQEEWSSCVESVHLGSSTEKAEKISFISASAEKPPMPADWPKVEHPSTRRQLFPAEDDSPITGGIHALGPDTSTPQLPEEVETTSQGQGSQEIDAYDNVDAIATKKETLIDHAIHIEPPDMELTDHKTREQNFSPGDPSQILCFASASRSFTGAIPVELLFENERIASSYTKGRKQRSSCKGHVGRSNKDVNLSNGPAEQIATPCSESIKPKGTYKRRFSIKSIKDLGLSDEESVSYVLASDADLISGREARPADGDSLDLNTPSCQGSTSCGRKPLDLRKCYWSDPWVELSDNGLVKFEDDSVIRSYLEGHFNAKSSVEDNVALPDFGLPSFSNIQIHPD